MNKELLIISVALLLLLPVFIFFLRRAINNWRNPPDEDDPRYQEVRSVPYGTSIGFILIYAVMCVFVLIDIFF